MIAENELKKRIRTETFNGKEIHYFDFSSLMAQDFVQLVDLALLHIKQHQDILLLFDLNNATVFGEAFEAAKHFAKAIQPYRKKSALIGITGPKKILLDSVLFFSRSAAGKVSAFSSKEAAFEWLSKE